MLAMQVSNSRKQVMNFKTEYETLLAKMKKRGSIEELESKIH